MSESPQIIPLPERGLRGIRALIDLGPERLARLAETQADCPLNLSFSNLFAELSEQLQCEERTLQRAFMDGLIPLNGLRRILEMSAHDFIGSLAYSISQRAPEEWKTRNLEEWNRIRPQLAPFFEPDNFFSQASKAFELLSQRPAIFQRVKILTDLRPIYDETTAKTLAVVQTNTLVLSYWDGEGERTLHVTLDSSDLQAMSHEVERARQKACISQAEWEKIGVHFITYGD